MTGILDGRWDCIFQLLHVAAITRHKESNPNKIWIKVKNTSNTPSTLFDQTCPITGVMMNYQHKQCTIKREILQSYHIFAASHSYPNLGGGFKHYFMFTPIWGKISNLTNMFQMGYLSSTRNGVIDMIPEYFSPLNEVLCLVRPISRGFCRHPAGDQRALSSPEGSKSPSWRMWATWNQGNMRLVSD